MLYSDLESKDVINVVNGCKLGHVSDIDIEPNTGKICFIKVKRVLNIFSFFSNNKGKIIHWDQIVKIGKDAVLVNYLDKDQTI